MSRVMQHCLNGIYQSRCGPFPDAYLLRRHQIQEILQHHCLLESTSKVWENQTRSWRICVKTKNG